MSVRPPLFTARFFVMCAFTFTVFLSAFMLLPTAPFRIVSVGGTKAEAGLFLGFLTYASALSAPVTGALADLVGKRRMLVTCGLVLAGLAAAYGLTRTWVVPLLLAAFHGVFWSGLLSASAAYLTDLIPESRRAEGIGYWGLSTIVAMAFAPSTGLWLFRFGWGWVCAACCVLNLVMTAIAFSLPDTDSRGRLRDARLLERGLIEWRVLRLAVTLFLYSFGYGAITSFVALHADSLGVGPRGLYFTALAASILVVRPISGPLGDRVGHLRVLVPSLLSIVAGLALLALSGGRLSLVVSALVFGSGFGSAYPVFVAYVMKRVEPRRRGAAFGSILAAFDTGIGTGSIATGLLVQRFGFATAFGAAAILAALSLPYFLWADARDRSLTSASRAA
ncbi:MAG TPA: MFS transporter [Vicinamibacteria bacterium]|nr:MFS transporter [Vicinamibacteria bacterium]